MGKYNLLLADADGTLLDFAQAEKLALADACEEMGIPLDAERMGAYTRINDDLWKAFERREVTQPQLRVLRFARFFEKYGIREDPEAMAEVFIRTLSSQADALPGALEFVQRVSARMPIVIVTNGIPVVQRSRFSLSPLQAFIREYVISGEMGFAKPDPRMVAAAIDRSGVKNPVPLMLGDEPRSDIAAAAAAGVDSCWLNPKGRKNTSGVKPTYEVRALEEVLRII